MQKYINKNNNLEYRLENSLIVQGSRKYISKKIIKQNQKNCMMISENWNVLKKNN